MATKRYSAQLRRSGSGNLVWHNDEIGNSFSLGFNIADSPIFIFLEGSVVQASSQEKLIALDKNANKWVLHPYIFQFSDSRGSYSNIDVYNKESWAHVLHCIPHRSVVIRKNCPESSITTATNKV